ncbi:hypothetical protein [Solidesulfovibrio carbinolicus]|uniref:Uncharacterized protein n=1 Tax=Solidesulfovibrio carbinolicus TaxID=296842 RepID=A0A4P6HGE1_9BACT|nr:hypothetical protein [Solidesulfovibrio carbinolicus]QAZ66007.1 hypothetical protein C3Y92_01620 [Solidesulfovibrio carbinolicus]
MAAIAAASPIGAYQREASRLTPAAPRVPGKVISREAGLSFGPFSLRYSATDYEFDLSGASPQASSFADALDAAAASALLAETPALGQTPPPNAYTRRQALAGYATAAAVTPQTASGPTMLSLRV